MLKAAGFLLMPLIPLLGPLGYALHTWWLAPAVVFVMVPLFDLVLSVDDTSINAEGSRWRWYFWTVPHLYVLTWIGCLGWTAHVLPKVHDGGQVAGLLLAAGIGSGFATCASHELLHRGRVPDYWTSRVAMAICCYGHFVVEHLHHHATVGRVEKGTVPRVGESLWHFVGRNVAFGFRNAYAVAERMRRRSRQGWLGNRVVQQHLLSLAIAVLAGVVFGLAGVEVFAVQAAVAILTVEFVQYCEHYGLTREEEIAAGATHSWNGDGWLTNALTLNIARHSDHHLDASTSFERLEKRGDAPHMPMGYFGMFWLSLIPALWASVVHPRLPETDQER